MEKKWTVDTEDGRKVVKRSFHPLPFVGGIYMTKSGNFFKVTKINKVTRNCKCVMVPSPAWRGLTPIGVGSFKGVKKK